MRWCSRVPRASRCVPCRHRRRGECDVCRCCVLLLLAFSSYGVCVCCELNCVEAGSARRAGWSPSSCAGQDELELVISSFCCQTEFLVSWVVVFLGGGSLVWDKKRSRASSLGEKIVLFVVFLFSAFSLLPQSSSFDRTWSPTKKITISNTNTASRTRQVISAQRDYFVWVLDATATRNNGMHSAPPTTGLRHL